MPIDRDAYRTGGAGPPRPGTGLAFRPGGGGVASWAGGTASTDPLRATLALMAPGTVLRDGLERILRGRTGALIVIGYDDSVESICDGGFELDVRYAPTRLRELSKMDGAVVLSDGCTKLALRGTIDLLMRKKRPRKSRAAAQRLTQALKKRKRN